MQVIHEAGHVTVARLTGGKVIKVILDPRTVSRTDIGHNPHPLAVVWGGPIIGSVFPVLLFGLARFCRWPGAYLFRFFAGFCLVANGVYIGTGWMLAEGADPGVMIQNGSPRWLLVLFGVVTIPAGFFLWHRQGANFGLGEAHGRVSARAAVVSMVLFIAVVAVELELRFR
jgi:hypothetical protein